MVDPNMGPIPRLNPFLSKNVSFLVVLFTGMLYDLLAEVLETVELDDVGGDRVTLLLMMVNLNSSLSPLAAYPHA